MHDYLAPRRCTAAVRVVNVSQVAAVHSDSKVGGGPSGPSFTSLLAEEDVKRSRYRMRLRL